MKKICVGIIGVGRIGKIHLNNLSNHLKSIEIGAISDIDEKKEKLCKDYGINKFYKSYKNLVLDKAIDAILICSPTNLHSEQIIFSAKHGKDIFCEKPVDLSLEKTKKVLKIINKTKIKFMIGFNRRFDPDFMQVKKMICNGKIGKVQIIKITSRDPNPPSATVSTFVDPRSERFSRFLGTTDASASIREPGISEIHHLSIYASHNTYIDFDRTVAIRTATPLGYLLVAGIDYRINLDKIIKSKVSFVNAAGSETPLVIGYVTGF